MSVIVPFVESAAEVLNARVTRTLGLAATRSPAAIVNVAAVGLASTTSPVLVT